MKFALTGARIFDGHQFQNGCALLVTNDTVTAIVSDTAIPTDYQQQHLDQGILAPGYIDLQINGAGGVQFNNSPESDSISTMANTLAQFGVTRFLPTVITDEPAITKQAIAAALASVHDDSGALGIHVEGPFFNTQKAGVHQPEKIRKLQTEDWSWLEQLAQLPSILTLAPEQVTGEDIARLNNLGIRVCAGHTNACYHEVLDAWQHGLAGFTHLFNAMRPMTGREPGVVGAALSLQDSWAGIIADGIHVHPESLKIAMTAKGYERIFLVSDAMATVGSAVKTFELYGEVITEQDGRLINAQGKLAGSAISLEHAVRYCVDTLDLPAEQALAMASRIPAEFMRQDHRLGQFKPGYLADICWLDDNLKTQRTWRAGRVIHSAQEI